LARRRKTRGRGEAEGRPADQEKAAGGAREDQACPKPSVRRARQVGRRNVAAVAPISARAADVSMRGTPPPHPLGQQSAQWETWGVSRGADASPVFAFAQLRSTRL
jgi:hypothetical protein